MPSKHNYFAKRWRELWGTNPPDILQPQYAERSTAGSHRAKDATGELDAVSSQHPNSDFMKYPEFHYTPRTDGVAGAGVTIQENYITKVLWYDPELDWSYYVAEADLPNVCKQVFHPTCTVTYITFGQFPRYSLAELIGEAIKQIPNYDAVLVPATNAKGYDIIKLMAEKYAKIKVFEYNGYGDISPITT